MCATSLAKDCGSGGVVTGKGAMKVVGWPLAEDSESGGVGTGKKQRRQ